MVDGKIILDACCGSRMMWFDKKNPLALFADIRSGYYSTGNGDQTVISPDVVADFRSLPFDSNTFKLLVFDPPHSKWLGGKSILGQKYGQLFSTWEDDIKKGFDECMRVLQPYGIMIFKWNDKDIKLNKLLQVIQSEPLFGHTSGKHGKTIWLCFMKQLTPPAG